MKWGGELQGGGGRRCRSGAWLRMSGQSSRAFHASRLPVEATGSVCVCVCVCITPGAMGGGCVFGGIYVSRDYLLGA